MMTAFPVDLRSDSVTRPSPGMRDVIARAAVGDDAFHEDPEVNALEEEVAALFGFDAAVFTPSGTLANQLAVRVLTPPGSELICDEQAHLVRAESGATALLGGVPTRTWRCPEGKVGVDDLRGIAAPAAPAYLVSTGLVSIENTHNFSGGTVQSHAALEECVRFAHASKMKVHIDGSRIWNAHAATGTPLVEIAAGADTMTICFSKGLGSPAGSALLGSEAAIAEARVWRKRYGGGMRQIGFLAAAARYAIRYNLSKLGDDHRRAKELASGLGCPAPETNIVLLTTDDEANALAGRLASRGLLVGTVDRNTVRLVTHLDIDDAMISTAVSVIGQESQ